LTKTEKLKAKVGERILIANSCDRRYRNGSIGVAKEERIGGVFVDNIGEGNIFVYHEEYEVIVDETEADNVGIIEKLQVELSQTKDELEALKKRVDELETKQRVRKSFAEYREIKAKKMSLEESHEDLLRIFTEKKQQQRRDEIIEKAKRDIDELKVTHHPTLLQFYNVGKYVKYECNAEFIVNKEKRTVVCLMREIQYDNKGKVVSKGIAKCAPDDCFNVHLGKVIALYKALGLEVPDEYQNAPQPTEVRVGDIVYVPYSLFSNRRRVTDKLIPSVIDEIKVELAARYISLDMARIIDDSRED